METYIVRLYRAEIDEEETAEALGVVEVAGKNDKHYFTKIDELPAIIKQLYKTNSNLKAG